MIVISSSLVLAQAGDVNANNPIIGYRNIATAANIVADTEAALYPATNLANPSTVEQWVGGDTTEQYLTVTPGAEDIDYVAVAKHNFGSAGIVVSIEGDDGGGFAEVVGEQILADDAPVLFRFDPQPYSEIRLKMQSGSAAPQAAVLYVGELLVLQRRIYVGHTPITNGRRTQITNGRSEAGDFLGRIVVSEHLETAVSLQNLTPSWYRAYLDPFIAAAQETPFFFAWRPSTYPNEVGYATITNDPTPVNSRSNGMMSIDLQMAGIAT